MLKIFKKNGNLIILIILLKIFSSSLSEFIETSDEIKISADNKVINAQNIQKNEKSEFKKFTLVKRIKKEQALEISPEKREVKIAKFRSPEITSDYINDEATMNLNLVPINERLLFSGIPVPNSKPHPTQKFSSRFEVLSVSNKKELKKILNERIKFIVNFYQFLSIKY